MSTPKHDVSTPKHDPKRRALGKGLESLLPSRPATVPAVIPQIKAEAEPDQPPVPRPAPEPAGKPLEIELSLIERNPQQTRTSFDREKLTELAQSIAASGVVQPVVVRPLPDGRYQLIAGERRWLASFEAGKTHIPAFVREVSDEQAMEMTIVENLQRADLNPMEQARAFYRLATDFKMSQSDMSVRTGLSRSAVANYIRLTKLPEPVQAQIEAGELSFGHAKILAALEPGILVAAARRVAATAMSVRQTETLVQELLHPEPKVKIDKTLEIVDPNVRAIQNTLQHALGLRVKIEDKNGHGKVIIEYTKIDEFEELMKVLTRA